MPAHEEWALCEASELAQYAANDAGINVRLRADRACAYESDGSLLL